MTTISLMRIGIRYLMVKYIPPTPWNTNNELPEDELTRKLRSIEAQVDRKTILITHRLSNCNTSCLWTDWLLRGYIIDMEDKSIKRIEKQLLLKELEII